VTFLVLGRPRSRTAWVANFLSVPPRSLCLHEGLSEASARPSRLPARLAQLAAREVGDADTGLIHHLDETLETFPDARMVLLTGGEAGWHTWASAKGLPSKLRDRVDADYRRAEERLRDRALYVDSGLITVDEQEAKRLWLHCLPEGPWSRDRWAILRDLNVQVIPRSVARRLRAMGLQTGLGLQI